MVTVPPYGAALNIFQRQFQSFIETFNINMQRPIKQLKGKRMNKGCSQNMVFWFPGHVWGDFALSNIPSYCIYGKSEVSTWLRHIPSPQHFTCSLPKILLKKHEIRMWMHPRNVPFNNLIAGSTQFAYRLSCYMEFPRFTLPAGSQRQPGGSRDAPSWAREISGDGGSDAGESCTTYLEKYHNTFTLHAEVWDTARNCQKDSQDIWDRIRRSCQMNRDARTETELTSSRLRANTRL